MSLKRRLLAAIEAELELEYELADAHRYEVARLELWRDELERRGSGPLPAHLRAIADVRYGIPPRGERP